jgi:DNA-binding transcriptional LysR family regulator
MRSKQLPALKHLECFVAVANTRHFSEAANHLGMAQPPLSQQIQRLEKLIGHTLFQRSSAGRNRVRLTPAGTALLTYAMRALNAAETGLKAARTAGDGKGAALTIGFVGSIADSILAPLLAELGKSSPIDLTLKELTTAEQAMALDRGEIDLGLAREVPELPGCASLILRQEPFVALLPHTHALSEASDIAPRDLCHDPFVMIPEGTGSALRDRIMSVCRRAGFEPTIAQEAKEWTTIIGLVSAGLGVSIAPSSAAPEVHPKILAKPLRDGLAVTTVSAWWRSDDEATALRDCVPVLRAFVGKLAV